MNRSKSAAAVVVLALGASHGAAQGLPTARPETIGLAPARLAEIAPALRGYVDQGQLAGMVAVIARRGQVGYLEAIGSMDIARQVPMRADAVFRIFSMTKPIVAAGIAALAEQGKLRLDDPVSKFIPAFARISVYAGGPAANPSLRPPATPMTVRHLLTHTAGLTYGFFGNTPVDSIYRGRDLSGPTMTTAAFADSLARLPLLFAPGEGWNYSFAIDLLGRIAEVASGQPLDRFLETTLFRPLGMRETSFRQRASHAGRLPVLYSADRGGKLVPNAESDGMYTAENRFLSGGGGLLSTVADYLRFAQMLLNGGVLDGQRVLSTASVAAMMSNQLPPALTPIRSLIVGHAGYGHGLGGVVLVDSSAAQLPGSPGIYRWWGYAGTFFWVDPTRELIGMVWTQFIPGRAYPVERDFQRLVYQAIVE